MLTSSPPRPRLRTAVRERVQRGSVRMPRKETRSGVRPSKHRRTAPRLVQNHLSRTGCCAPCASPFVFEYGDGPWNAGECFLQSIANRLPSGRGRAATHRLGRPRVSALAQPRCRGAIECLHVPVSIVHTCRQWRRAEPLQCLFFEKLIWARWRYGRRRRAGRVTR